MDRGSSQHFRAGKSASESAFGQVEGFRHHRDFGVESMSEPYWMNGDPAALGEDEEEIEIDDPDTLHDSMKEDQ